jgi:hypothetical protein
MSWRKRSKGKLSLDQKIYIANAKPEKTSRPRPPHQILERVMKIERMRSSGPASGSRFRNFVQCI